MKKVLISILISVVSAALLTGCASDAETVIGDSVSSETTEEISEETPVASEEVTASEETSIEEVEEVVMYSADEVISHIDSLITQYQYNDPEHIKALVIAANLDYISEDDLNTILTTYEYTMEELAVKYDECILDNATSRKISTEYYLGNVDSLPNDKEYSNRITIESIMLNDNDRKNSEWYDTLLINMSYAKASVEHREEYVEIIQNISNDLSSAERTIYSYSIGIFTNTLSYTDYLDNPFVAYNK